MIAARHAARATRRPQQGRLGVGPLVLLAATAALFLVVGAIVVAWGPGPVRSAPTGTIAAASGPPTAASSARPSAVASSAPVLASRARIGPAVASAPALVADPGVVVIPQPIPLQRTMREYRVLPTGELPPTALVGNPAQTRASSTDGRRSAQVGGALLSEQALDLPYYPGALTDPASATWAQDRDSGASRTITLVSHDPAERIVAYYRDRLRAGGSVGVNGSSPSPDQVLLEVADPGGGRRSVLVWAMPDEVRITLMRWSPPARPG